MDKRWARLSGRVVDVAEQDDMVASLEHLTQGTGDPCLRIKKKGRPSSSFHHRPMNLSGNPLLANQVAISCWSADKTLIRNRRACKMMCSSPEWRFNATSIIGGSIDSDAKALTVAPWGCPASAEVTTETALATWVITERNWSVATTEDSAVSRAAPAWSSSGCGVLPSLGLVELSLDLSTAGAINNA